MPTRLDTIFKVRDLLDNPVPSRPSFHQLFRQAISEEQDMANALNVSGQSWGVEEYQLNYSPGLDTYAINVSNFGKVLYVSRLTGNPYIREVCVPFDDMQNQHYGSIWTNWWNVYGSFFQPDTTPEHASFYRQGTVNAQYMVKINPMPMQGWVYKIVYIPGYIGSNDPLETAVQMPEHVELVRLRMAMALLPYAEWGDDPVMNTDKRKQLMAGFEYQLRRKETLFSTYIKNINIPRSELVADWNS